MIFSSELDLPWDPLSESHHEMNLAQESLVTKQPTFEPLPDKNTPCVKDDDKLGKEIFSKDDFVSDSRDEAVELPMSMSLIGQTEMDRCEMDTDIPMLGLKQTGNVTY